MGEILRAVKYKRVSTTMQTEEGVSLDNQDERIDAFCKSQGWMLVSEFADEGISAKDIENRPGIQDLIEAIKRREFDVVVVYKLDRLVRRVKDLHELLQIMDEYDVKFKSVTEPFDTTTPAGRLFITMVAAIAEWERETIAERVYDSLKYRAEQGLRNGGPAPYGYQYDENFDLVKNEEQAKNVKFIFDKYKTTGSTNIAKELNKKGERTGTDSLWSDFAVRAILKNPIYAGHNRWNRRSPVKGKSFTGKDIVVELQQESGFEPIISIEQFRETEKLMEERSHMAFRTDEYYPYSGVAKCPKCGESFAGSKKLTRSGKIYRFYKCAGRFRKGICDFTVIPEVSFDNAFIEAIDIKNVASQFKPSKNNDVPIDRAEVEKKLKKIQQKKARAKELYIEGDLSKAEYQKKLAEHSAEEKELNGLNQAVSKEVRQEALINLLEQLKDNWTKMPYESRKAALQSLFESITFELIKPTKMGRNAEPAVLKVKDYTFK